MFAAFVAVPFPEVRLERDAPDARLAELPALEARFAVDPAFDVRDLDAALLDVDVVLRFPPDEAELVRFLLPVDLPADFALFFAVERLEPDDEVFDELFDELFFALDELLAFPVFDPDLFPDVLFDGIFPP